MPRSPRKSVELSIIIPYYRSARHTWLRVRACIRYAPVGREILVVCHRLSPTEQNKLRSFAAAYNEVSLLQYPDTVSYGTLCNRAARKASGEFLLFLQKGIELRGEADNLLREMMLRAADLAVGPVGCLLLSRDRKYIRHAGIFKLPGRAYGLLYVNQKLSKAIRHIGTRTFPYDIRKSRPVQAVNGALLIGRLRYRQCKGFNEDSSLNGDQAELELCLRCNRNGLQTWYQAGVGLIAEDDGLEEMLHEGGIPASPLITEPAGSPDGDPLLPALTAANLSRPTRRNKQPLIKRLLQRLRKKSSAA